MNASNPFQIPTAYQIELENRRRERFKKTVIIAVCAVVALLVGLLIEGCVSEHSKTALASPDGYVADQPAATTVIAAPQPVPEAQQPASIPQPAPVVQSASVVPPVSATPASQAAETIYVVRSGDTLSRIAYRHHVTIKALKSANKLSSDNIVVGARLKIPAA